VRPRTVARVARWEVTKGAGKIDRRTVAVGVVGLLLGGVVLVAVAGSGVALDEGIYRVGVAEDHPYHGPASTDSTLAVREPDREAFRDGRLEVLAVEGQLVVADSRKGRAALAELRGAAERYNDRQLRAEDNRTAAFPVEVTLRYVERENVRDVIAPGAGGGGGGDDTDGGGDDGGDIGAGDGPSGGLGGGVFGGGIIPDPTAGGTPSDIAPPFPFQSLVLAFVFVLPLNFVIQAYGSSMLAERTNRRGELLLVAPVTRGEIIAGKTLPYFAVSIGIAAFIAFAIGGGPVSVLAVVPLALLFLAATFLSAMFARSFKELTFLTVTVSVFLTSYAFVPAVFTDVGPVALISPLTLVVRDLTAGGVAASGVAFATLPATLTALVLFGFGAGLYREEDMFTQRSVPLKLLDALVAPIRRARSLVLVTALLLPFVFVAELLAVATLFALPFALSLPVLLAVIALVEEVAKSLPVLAGFEHARYPRTATWAIAAGAASGLGFFIGEKLTLMVQLVGLPELRLGRAAFAPAGIGVDGPLLVLLLLAPLALHTVTAAVSALGATRGTNGYAAGLVAAVAIHLVYNLTVVSGLV